MQESFWWCYDRYIISLSTPPGTPFPLLPVLNKPTVSVDVKQHVIKLISAGNSGHLYLTWVKQSYSSRKSSTTYSYQ